MKLFRSKLMMLALLGLTPTKPTQAQSPALDSFSCACRAALSRSPNPKTPDLPTLLRDTQRIFDPAGKPTGLPRALYQAVQQAPETEALALTLQAFYRVPWPGRRLLVHAVKNRFPNHACTTVLEAYLH